MRALGVTLIAFVVVLIAGVYAVRLWPSQLFIRIDPAVGSSSAALQTSFHSDTRSPIPASGELRVPLTSHAMYTVDLPLASGQHLWTRYVHTDSGDRRRVDMYFSRGSAPDSCHVRITANKWFFPNQLVLLDADVRAADTSEEHPEGVL
jgi:hypothetical protein